VTEYENWKEFYPNTEEQLPDHMPMPYGKKARITVYIDADHAHDVVTHQSVTAILLFINNMPVQWYSKRQRTVEMSMYGAELVAARIATDMIIKMHFILHMLGVPVDGPALLLGDNNSVVLNTSVPSSILKKKHHACAYHRVQEAIACPYQGHNKLCQHVEQTAVKQCISWIDQATAAPCAEGRKREGRVRECFIDALYLSLEM
jgi:hypothetical protein